MAFFFNQETAGFHYKPKFGKPGTFATTSHTVTCPHRRPGRGEIGEDGCDYCHFIDGEMRPRHGQELASGLFSLSKSRNFERTALVKRWVLERFARWEFGAENVRNGIFCLTVCCGLGFCGGKV